MLSIPDISIFSDSDDDMYITEIEEQKKKQEKQDRRRAQELARIKTEHQVRKAIRAAKKKRLTEEARIREEEKQRVEEEKHVQEEAKHQQVKEKKKKKKDEKEKSKKEKCKENQRGQVEQLDCVEIPPSNKKKTGKRKATEQPGGISKKIHLETASAKATRGVIGVDGQPIKMGMKKTCKRCLQEGWECLPQGLAKSYACIACSKLKQKCVLAVGVKNSEHQNNVEASGITSNGRLEKNLKQKTVLRKTTRHKKTEMQSGGAVLETRCGLKALLIQFAKALGSMAEEM